MQGRLTALVLLLCVVCSAIAQINLSNSKVSFSFDELSFSLRNVTNTITGYESLVSQSPSSIWQLQLVQPSQSIVVDSFTSSMKSHRISIIGQTQQLELVWANIDVPGYENLIDVQLIITLPNDSGLAAFRLNVQNRSPSLGIWHATLRIAGLGATDGAPDHDSIFVPVGYGVVADNPTSQVNLPFTATYPGSASLQFSAYTHQSPKTNVRSSVYVGAHDPVGSIKDIAIRTALGMTSFSEDLSSSNIILSNSIEFGMYPRQMGTGGASFQQEWDLVVGVFEGDWFDAAQIYKQWALPNAAWTQQGPISERKDFPAWMLNNTVWVNSGWQFHDVFNKTQGDPDVVLQVVSAIKKRFDTPLALHWYVWDDIAFDTGYPEYFPAKSGFKEAVTTLQSLDVNVAPYINGRIFDVNTRTWTKDNAKLYAAKQAAPLVDHHNLSLYQESYGSGATFAVMCPGSPYWQQEIANVVGELVTTYGTHGVYIDQVAAAHAVPCWDPTHNHDMGGGDYWRQGYNAMMQAAREASKGEIPALVTESNCETFMAGVNGYLTLPAFGAGGFSGDVRIAPAFPSIYGGYYIGFGQTWTQADFANGATAFTAKLGNSFVYGTQLGWFSLSGTTDNPPMGIFPQLMSSQYDAQVGYIHTLSTYRTLALDYLVHGSLMRPVTVESANEDLLSVKTHRRPLSSDLLSVKTHRRPLSSHEGSPPRLAPHQNKKAAEEDSDVTVAQFPNVMSAVWSGQDQSIAVLITNSQQASAVFATTLDMKNYGYPNADSETFTLTQVTPQGETKIATFPGNAVAVKVNVPGYDVVFYKVALIH